MMVQNEYYPLILFNLYFSNPIMIKMKMAYHNCKVLDFQFFSLNIYNFQFKQVNQFVLNFRFMVINFLKQFSQMGYVCDFNFNFTKISNLHLLYFKMVLLLGSFICLTQIIIHYLFNLNSTKVMRKIYPFKFI